jgi:hypothetical protein
MDTLLLFVLSSCEDSCTSIRGLLGTAGLDLTDSWMKSPWLSLVIHLEDLHLYQISTPWRQVNVALGLAKSL